MDKTISRRLEALEQASGGCGVVVAFGVTDEVFALIDEEARAAGKRALRWPVAVPAIERKAAGTELPVSMTSKAAL